MTPSANPDFFKDQFRAHGFSLRTVAKMMKNNPSSLSRSIQGKRRMQLEEAAQLAEILTLPISEVLSQLGVSGGPSVANEETIRITGWVDANLKIRMELPKGGPKTAPLPIWGGTDLCVLRCQTSGGMFEGMDGSLLYYRPAKGVGTDVVGRMCVVRPHGVNSNGWLLRTVRRGYKSGSFNLLAPNGAVIEQDVRLDSASPILWMKM